MGKPFGYNGLSYHSFLIELQPDYGRGITDVPLTALPWQSEQQIETSNAIPKRLAPFGETIPPLLFNSALNLLCPPVDER
ncbi:MAG: hypothetical protein U0V70_10350 [Terriglobia bacterium]